MPALGEFHRLQKPSDIYRIPSGFEVLQGMKQTPSAPEFPMIPEAEPDRTQEDTAALVPQPALTAVSGPTDEVCFPCSAATCMRVVITVVTFKQQSMLCCIRFASMWLHTRWNLQYACCDIGTRFCSSCRSVDLRSSACAAAGCLCDWPK